eukprot:1853544-Rhodomonas_salina.1
MASRGGAPARCITSYASVRTAIPSLQYQGTISYAHNTVRRELSPMTVRRTTATISYAYGGSEAAHVPGSRDRTQSSKLATDPRNSCHSSPSPGTAARPRSVPDSA